MFPFNLLIARSRAGKIRPVYVPIDSRHMSLESEMVEVFERRMERRKRELYTALEVLEGASYDYRLIRGLCTLLERRCTFEAKTYVDPREARRTVFTEANKYPLVGSEATRETVIANTASKPNVTSQQLEASLWNDLDQELVLKQFLPFATEDLLKQYDMSLTQTRALR